MSFDADAEDFRIASEMHRSSLDVAAFQGEKNSGVNVPDTDIDIIDGDDDDDDDDDGDDDGDDDDDAQVAADELLQLIFFCDG